MKLIELKQVVLSITVTRNRYCIFNDRVQQNQIQTNQNISENSDWIAEKEI